MNSSKTKTKINFKNMKNYITYKNNLYGISKEEVSSNPPLKINVSKKETKGDVFKKKHGMSRTMYRNMKKLGLNPSIGEDRISYKTKRKSKAKARKKIIQRKHQDSVIYMAAKGKVRTTKHKKRKSSGAAKVMYVAPKETII